MSSLPGGRLVATVESAARRLAPPKETLGPLAGPVGQVERLARAAEVLVRAGVLRPNRPDRVVRSLLVLLRQGMTPAAGFAASAERYPDHTALVDERGALTFAEVHARTNALANAFADAGVGEGERVAVMCRDHRGFVEASVAASKLGADALYLNTAFAGPQLTEVVKREEPVAIVYDAEFEEVLRDAKRRRRRFVAWPEGAAKDPLLDELIAEGDRSQPVPPGRAGRAVLLTSGTTGTPKGASRGADNALEPIVALLSRLPLRARETTMMAAPLFHAWGFLHFQLGLLLSSTYLLRRRFDPEETLAWAARHRATALPLVPIMMQRILDLPEETRRLYDVSSLRAVAASGGPLSGELSERFMDEFGDVVHNFYGSTEVAWAAIATPTDLRAAPGTSGPPPPGTSLRILDRERDVEVPAGEMGRIFVGNQMLFEGYTGGGGKDIVDGHMATGDLGHLDEEGRLFVEGRDDEMIVSGGENVFPQEVESILERHPKISEAAVVGVDDEEFGQRLKAFVVAEDGLGEDEVKSHVKQNLAGFKVPRDVEFLDELPRNPQGKVQKRALEGDDEEE